MSQTNAELALAVLQAALGDHQARQVEVVQSLWSGYGQIARFWLPSRQQHVIIKTVNPAQRGQHPRGWNSSFSHQRKLSSYRNEQCFYQQYSQLADSFCRLPECLATGSAQGLDYVVMEDLDQAGFELRFDAAPLTRIQQGVRWLAYFHACYFAIPTDGLWPVGSYWHLSTRPDEYQKMPASRLKQAASWLDQSLNQASYQTLLHGDAKLANFCFSAEQDLAAVDFQYVGRGVGVKDLVYFLGSCLQQEGLEQHAEALTKAYFRLLGEALQHYNKVVDVHALEQQWRQLIPLVWADFQRFLASWASEHSKLNGYMQQQTELALQAAPPV